MKSANVSAVDSLDKLCHDAGVDLPQQDEGVMLVTCSKEGYIRAHVLRLGIMTEGRLEMHQMTLYKALIAARARAHNRRIPAGMMEGDNVIT